MEVIKRSLQILDTHVLPHLTSKKTTASFWYLPEPPNIKTKADLTAYQMAKTRAPFYLMDYRAKLKYEVINADGIIVLPYPQPIGHQVNPEAAFQYTLGLHDAFCKTQEARYIDTFWRYVNYFLNCQTAEGLWAYRFDWYTAKAPWYSALAQSRGAAVMLRAFLHSNDLQYLESAKKAVSKFVIPTAENGFLHVFPPEQCGYFEEYPLIPTGVINGFMASLMSIWELNYWIREKWLDDLWHLGIQSLEKMLPHYTNGWWSLYDLDDQSPIKNVNSPRYHLLEVHYLQVLSILSASNIIEKCYRERSAQYNARLRRLQATGLKLIRKILYK